MRFQILLKKQIQIKYLNRISWIKLKLEKKSLRLENKKRLKNSINSSSFEKLKDYENKFGFSESIKSKNYNKAIPFFHLGPNNDWKKILEDDLKKKLNVTFNKSLKFFSYI